MVRTRKSLLTIMSALLASWHWCTMHPVLPQLCPLTAAPCGHLIDRLANEKNEKDNDDKIIRHIHESSSGRTQRNVEHTSNLLRQCISWRFVKSNLKVDNFQFYYIDTRRIREAKNRRCYGAKEVCRWRENYCPGNIQNTWIWLSLTKTFIRAIPV